VTAGTAGTAGPDDALLLETLQALETELHHPGTPCTPDRLQALLHPQFHEVGRSGLAYDRATVTAYLAQRATPPAVQSCDFTLSRLAQDVALLSYRSTELRDGSVEPLRTWRASLWVHTAQGWQLRYHQGTPMAASL